MKNGKKLVESDAGDASEAIAQPHMTATIKYFCIIPVLVRTEKYFLCCSYCRSFKHDRVSSRRDEALHMEENNSSRFQLYYYINLIAVSIQTLAIDSVKKVNYLLYFSVSTFSYITIGCIIVHHRWIGLRVFS